MRLPGPWTPGRPGCSLSGTHQPPPVEVTPFRALEDLKVTALGPEEWWERSPGSCLGGKWALCWAEPRSASRRRPGHGGAPGAPPAPPPRLTSPPQERAPEKQVLPSHMGGADEPDLRVFSDAETACSGATSWKSHSSRAGTVSTSRVFLGGQRRPRCVRARLAVTPGRSPGPAAALPSWAASACAQPPARAQHGRGAPGALAGWTALE